MEASIPRFFAQKSVFLTGATGFVGKAILEKLLRGCPEIPKVYVLVREKQGISGRERMREILQAPLFQRVRDENPDLLKKVVEINGDVTFNELGISPEDAGTLKTEVSVVIHSAANVNFNAGLQNLLKANVEGTRNMIQFAKQLQNLKSFVYVSTAFSNSDRLEIREKIYPNHLNPHVAIRLYSDLPVELVDSIISNLLNGNKVPYTFTKHLAEILIQESRFDLPVCIVRPALVGPAYEEPFQGWTDNFVGFAGGFVAMARGVVRVFLTNERGNVNIVPVDHVVNLTLAAAMSLGLGLNDANEVMVYHCSTSEHPFLDVKQYIYESIEETPFNKIYWYPSFVMISDPRAYAIMDYLLHYLPCLIADVVLKVIGKKPKYGMVDTYNRLTKLIYLTFKIMGTDFAISTENTQALYKQLTPADQKLFDFNMFGVNHRDYIRRSMYGLRRYGAGEDDRDLPRARENLKKYRRYYIASWAFVILAVALLFRLLFV